jgi:hypothetical protein
MRAVLVAAMMIGTTLPGSMAFAQSSGSPQPAGTAGSQGAAPAASTSSDSKAAPSPEAMAEARARYKRGLELFNEDKNYEAAKVEFLRAYTLAPSNVILYNIGVCDAQLNDYVAAITTLQKYLQQGGSEVTAERRAEVEKLLADLRPRIGKLVVTANVDGATVQVDDVSVCEDRGVCVTPVPEAIPVNPGRRRVTVSRAGYIPQTRSVVVAGSETARLDFTLTPTTTTVQKNVNLAPYVAWAVTGVLAVGAGVTGYLALSTSGDQKD